MFKMHLKVIRKANLVDKNWNAKLSEIKYSDWSWHIKKYWWKVFGNISWENTE
jgi:hypothetical protein